MKNKIIAIIMILMAGSAISAEKTGGDMEIKVRVSSICVEIPGKNLQARLDQVDKYLDEAGKLKSDIVCIPEWFHGEFGKKPSQIAEEIPNGKTAKYISEKAKKWNMNIIAPMVEKDGNKVYNCSVVFDRNGKVIGKYRKTHLAGGSEKPPNVYPGDDLPVIETDFGKIGIFTCHDMNFMEICRTYMLKGAEIVFWPTMWGVGANQPNQEEYFFMHIKSQAILNCLYIVPCDYAWMDDKHNDMPLGNSSIVDPNGNILATTGLKGGLASAEIILYKKVRPYKDQQDDYDVNYAIRKQAIMKERRPELYKIIADR